MAGDRNEGVGAKAPRVAAYLFFGAKADFYIGNGGFEFIGPDCGEKAQAHTRMSGKETV